MFRLALVTMPFAAAHLSAVKGPLWGPLLLLVLGLTTRALRMDLQWANFEEREVVEKQRKEGELEEEEQGQEELEREREPGRERGLARGPALGQERGLEQSL